MAAAEDGAQVFPRGAVSRYVACLMALPVVGSVFLGFVCLFVLGAGRKTPAVCRKIGGEALGCAGGDLGQRAAAREGIVERL